MLHNSDIHRRKSIRLKGYDYSKEGLYFITICTHDREKLCGEIIYNVGADLCVCPVLKSEVTAQMIEKWYFELEKKFKNIRCHEFVVMPNHFHCIIEITKIQGEHTGSPLPNIIQWFKTMTTNEYIKMVKENKLPNFNSHIWQRNYYENVIRNEERDFQIIKYIENNPIKWQEDKYFSE